MSPLFGPNSPRTPYVNQGFSRRKRSDNGGDISIQSLGKVPPQDYQSGNIVIKGKIKKMISKISLSGLVIEPELTVNMKPSSAHIV